MKAWYFSKDDCKLRYNDGRKIKAGITHRVDGNPKLCSHGLHGSVRVTDALRYAPGPYVWMVNITQDVDKGIDKICGKSRKYSWGFNADKVLREFARKQALINIYKAQSYFKSDDDYNLVVEFLKTGDESLRSAAGSAARSAAWSAVRSAVRSAARSAAWSAESAAWSAAESAAGSAAWSAAESAAESAAGSAAWSAVGSVAWSAAWSAARSAARSAAESAANKMLEEMLIKEAKRLGVYK